MISIGAPLENPLVVTPHGYYNAPRPQHTTGVPHLGLDFQAAAGDAVVAAAAGYVARTGFDPAIADGGGGGGNYVIVHTDDAGGASYELGYMHLDAIHVSSGDQVSEGALLGTAGATGTTSGGVHLHFQVKQLLDANTRKAIDPTPLMAIAGGGKAPGSTAPGWLVVFGIGWIVRRMLA
jgi:murein DD-endopeptidase MepM/ murein hydrolase activator NlpD